MAPLPVPRRTKSIQIRQTQKLTIRKIYVVSSENMVFPKKSLDGWCRYTWWLIDIVIQMACVVRRFTVLRMVICFLLGGSSHFLNG